MSSPVYGRGQGPVVREHDGKGEGKLPLTFPIAAQWVPLLSRLRERI